ncbi:UDP-galactose/UDP-glucose transporter 3-like isoform X1 [Musa acuminata AAA Group]|uniref:UDP-galactose/UDP-glucose transporter 3-like isoform X1 n=1 Tax=Musa acuminata AAA Group TaxID=214697 RepID=UPI0031D04744
MPSVGSSREMEGHEAAAGFDRVLLLAFCVVGIWSAYICQVVLQETVSTKLFGPDGKRFEHLSFLNLAQNAVCFLWSLIIAIKLWSRNSSGVAPLWSYWSPNISNTIGPSMGIEALKYISYPAQRPNLKRHSGNMQGLHFINLGLSTSGEVD